MIYTNGIMLHSYFYPTGSGQLVRMNFRFQSIANTCFQLKMSPEEAINAATINGAAAMELQQTTGSIQVGKKANLVITNPAPSIAFLPYDFGNNHIRDVLLNGNWVK